MKYVEVKKYVLIAGLLTNALPKIMAQDAPVIPRNTVTVTDFGAKGDGKTLNTAAIQKAIDKAKENGGKVIVPKGKFLCGPITLYSKINLELAKEAVLLLRNDISAYPIENNRYRNFISASGATDIKISGEGAIDGQGEVWWDAFRAKQLEPRRPQMVYMDKCKRLEISGITFLNPPNTHVSLKDCDEVTIRNITITAPATSPNTDGLNIAGKNYLIENCSIATGDDNIAVNFGGKPVEGHPECENIVVHNCRFGYGHGLSIGSFTSGGLRHMQVSDCSFDGTTSGIRMKSARGRGGLVEDVTYTDITIKNVRWPVFISSYYPKEPQRPGMDSAQALTAETPIWKDIVLKNIKITNAETALLLWGLPEQSIEGVRFDNVTISAQKNMVINFANNVVLRKSPIHAGDDLPSLYHADVMEDMHL